MNTNCCTRCHRMLKDPVSVALGMGPVCRAKSQGPAHHVGRPDGIHASEYKIVRLSSEFIWIEDTGTNCLSVTNDAENVVAIIAARYGNRRIIYKDSSGNWDELKHAGASLTGFAPARHLAPDLVAA